MKSILDLIVRRQKADGSFPRKFNDDGRVVDAGGGSTPSATLPLVMGSRYFGNHRWLMAARRTMDYIEKEIITPSDYFHLLLMLIVRIKRLRFTLPRPLTAWLFPVMAHNAVIMRSCAVRLLISHSRGITHGMCPLPKDRCWVTSV